MSVGKVKTENFVKKLCPNPYPWQLWKWHYRHYTSLSFICFCEYQLFLHWTKTQKCIGSSHKGYSPGIMWRIWISDSSGGRKLAGENPVFLCRCTKWKFIRYWIWETTCVLKSPLSLRQKWKIKKEVDTVNDLLHLIKQYSFT